MLADKSAFYGLKWTNEKKSKLKSAKMDDPPTKPGNDSIDEIKHSDNGGRSDSSVSTITDHYQKTTTTIAADTTVADVNTPVSNTIVTTSAINATENVGISTAAISTSISTVTAPTPIPSPTEKVRAFFGRLFSYIFDVPFGSIRSRGWGGLEIDIFPDGSLIRRLEILIRVCCMANEYANRSMIAKTTRIIFLMKLR